MLLLHRPLQQRRKLRHQADLPPQLERIALAHVASLVANRPRHRVGEPVQQPKQSRLAAPDGPATQLAPFGSDAVTSWSTTFESRSIVTRSSSNSIG